MGDGKLDRLRAEGANVAVEVLHIYESSQNRHSFHSIPISGPQGIRFNSTHSGRLECHGHRVSARSASRVEPSDLSTGPIEVDLAPQGCSMTKVTSNGTNSIGSAACFCDTAASRSNNTEKRPEATKLIKWNSRGLDSA